MGMVEGEQGSPHDFFIGNKRYHIHPETLHTLWKNWSAETAKALGMTEEEGTIVLSPDQYREVPILLEIDQKQT